MPGEPWSLRLSVRTLGCQPREGSSTLPGTATKYCMTALKTKNSLMYDRFSCTSQGDEPDEVDAPPKPKKHKLHFEHRIDPAHPYCTNWLTSKKDKDIL